MGPAAVIGGIIAAVGSIASAAIGAGSRPKPPKPPVFNVPTDAELKAKETAEERKTRLRKQRGVTQRKTILTSALGEPVQDQNVFRPTLGQG